MGTELLPEPPLEAWSQGNVHDIPILAGTVENEGVAFVYAAFGKPISKIEYDLVSRSALYTHTASLVHTQTRAQADNTAPFSPSPLFACVRRWVSSSVSMTASLSASNTPTARPLMPAKRWPWLLLAVSSAAPPATLLWVSLAQLTASRPCTTTSLIMWPRSARSCGGRTTPSAGTRYDCAALLCLVCLFCLHANQLHSTLTHRACSCVCYCRCATLRSLPLCLLPTERHTASCLMPRRW